MAAQHDPIFERALFDAVQARLDEQRRGKRRSRTSSEALFLGRREPKPTSCPEELISGLTWARLLRRSAEVPVRCILIRRVPSF
jgi:hypothetical protein